MLLYKDGQVGMGERERERQRKEKGVFRFLCTQECWTIRIASSVRGPTLIKSPRRQQLRMKRNNKSGDSNSMSIVHSHRNSSGRKEGKNMPRGVC